MVEQMKPSGIDWIGDIPRGWKISRIKYHYDISLGKMLQPLQEKKTEMLKDYLCSANVTWQGVDLSTIKQMWFDENEIKEYKLNTGDLIVSEGGDVAIACIWKDELSECYFQNAIHRVRQKYSLDNRFLYYWLYYLKNHGYIDLICNKATIAHFTKDKFQEIQICIMTDQEQKAIADFLDKQCGKIDGIISDLEKQIETLQKYKKSLILETVTKGLNKNAPMKPSGIDWIGDIPAHWETSKIKYNIGLIGSGTTPESGNPLYYEDGKYNWIQSGDLYRTDYINSTEKQLTALAIKDSPALTYYEKDFVVIAMYGASVGNVSISKIDAYTNQACCVIKAKNNDDIRYLFYYLKAAQEEMLLKAFGGTQPNISQIIIKNLNCLKVPNVEQKSISDYLDDKCGKIDSILKDKQEQLEKIKQHKKSLVYEYVTGKKRVKEATNVN